MAAEAVVAMEAEVAVATVAKAMLAIAKGVAGAMAAEAAVAVQYRRGQCRSPAQHLSVHGRTQPGA